RQSCLLARLCGASGGPECTGWDWRAFLDGGVVGGDALGDVLPGRDGSLLLGPVGDLMAELAGDAGGRVCGRDVGLAPRNAFCDYLGPGHSPATPCSR